MNVKVNYGKGYYLFKLDEALAKRNMTRYYLARHTFIEYAVIIRFAKGKVTKLELSVISKICDFLNCNLSDVLEYIPNVR